MIVENAWRTVKEVKRLLFALFLEIIKESTQFHFKSSSSSKFNITVPLKEYFFGPVVCSSPRLSETGYQTRLAWSLVFLNKLFNSHFSGYEIFV